MKFKSIFLLISVALIQNAVGQSNYASHANNINYLGKGLPEEATLDGKVSTPFIPCRQSSSLAVFDSPRRGGDNDQVCCVNRIINLFAHGRFSATHQLFVFI